MTFKFLKHLLCFKTAYLLSTGLLKHLSLFSNSFLTLYLFKHLLCIKTVLELYQFKYLKLSFKQRSDCLLICFNSCQFFDLFQDFSFDHFPTFHSTIFRLFIRTFFISIEQLSDYSGRLWQNHKDSFTTQSLKMILTILKIFHSLAFLFEISSYFK